MARSPKTRFRLLITALVVVSLFGGLSQSGRLWTDGRFVGAWRSTMTAPTASRVDRVFVNRWDFAPNGTALLDNNPGYSWSVRGDEIRIERSLADVLFDGFSIARITRWWKEPPIVITVREVEPDSFEGEFVRSPAKFRRIPDREL